MLAGVLAPIPGVAWAVGNGPPEPPPGQECEVAPAGQRGDCAKGAAKPTCTGGEVACGHGCCPAIPGAKTICCTNVPGAPLCCRQLSAEDTCEVLVQLPGVCTVVPS